MTPPEAERITDIPWWRRPKPVPPMDYPLIPEREQSECSHPHWQLRVPGRAVLRRQAARAGAYRPRRSSRGKGKGGRLPFYSPAVPKPQGHSMAILGALVNKIRTGNGGGDR